MWTFPTLEPAMVSGGSFVLDRLLGQPGEVLVRVGDTVTPETVVARSAAIEKPMTLFVASELGVPNDNVQRYLAKPVGSSFAAGDVIARARVRGGLRTVTVTAPSAGVLTSLDESTGTVTFAVSSGQNALHALVNGEVERVIPDFGAVIRASGSRIFGIVGFGSEAIGAITFGPDRPDRELTAEAVRDSWKGRIVVCGMTVGVPALQKLRQVGVSGVIVGSLAEADIRRFLTGGQAGAAASEVPPRVFWGSRHPAAPFAATAHDAPFVIVATEGFGRIPMAEALFAFLRDHEGETASIQAVTSVGGVLRRPEIYVTAAGAPAGQRASNDIVAGRLVRLTSGRQLGTIATCTGPAWPRVTDDGVVCQVADLQFPTGEHATVPVANLEVLS